MKKLIVWIVVLAIVVNTLVFNNSAQAAPMFAQPITATEIENPLKCQKTSTSEVYNCSNLVAQAVNDHIVRKLDFSDTEEFYKELVKNWKSGEPVNVITKYTDYTDFPSRLKEIFQPAPVVDVAPVYPSAPRLAVPSFAIPAVANLNAIYFWGYVITGATVGGAIGGAFGGIGVTVGVPVGAAGGAVFGLVASNVNQAAVSNDHTVSLKFGPGGIIIVITPVDRVL